MVELGHVGTVSRQTVGRTLKKLPQAPPRQGVGDPAEEGYPEAEKIRAVLDNLSTHTPAAFYESFPPEQARSLARRIEFVYTRCTALG